MTTQTLERFIMAQPLIIVRPVTESRTKCYACSETIPASTPRFQLRNKKGRSEGTFCPSCNNAKYPHKQAALNDDWIVDSFESPAESMEHDCERQREDYAAYLTAGVSSETYFNDRNAGYCN
jgi:hypothetical protein